MHPKDAEGIANGVDPDQTAPQQSDLGLNCLPRPVCLKTSSTLKLLKMSCYTDRFIIF